MGLLLGGGRRGRFGTAGNACGKRQMFGCWLPRWPRWMQTISPRSTSSAVALAAAVRWMQPSFAMVPCDSRKGWFEDGRWSHMISHTWTVDGARSRRPARTNDAGRVSNCCPCPRPSVRPMAWQRVAAVESLARMDRRSRRGAGVPRRRNQRKPRARPANPARCGGRKNIKRINRSRP